MGTPTLEPFPGEAVNHVMGRATKQSSIWTLKNLSNLEDRKMLINTLTADDLG